MPLLSLMDQASVRSARGTLWLRREAPDILWIQKKVTAIRLRTAATLKSEGCLVIYDCDESGPEVDEWAEPSLFREMLLLADVVTADTPERGEELKAIAPSCRVEVLENQVDYGDRLRAVHSAAPRAGDDELRVLWFGYGGNLTSLAPFGDVLSSLDGVRLVVCGAGRAQVRSVLRGMPVELRRWSRTRFVDTLRACDVTLLSHLGLRHHAAKSAHKFVTSVCHGVPALVSATPDYTRVAALAGVAADAVWNSPEDLRRLLDRMRSAEVRRAYLDRAQPRLLARYGPGSFAAAAAHLLRRLTQGTDAGPASSSRP